MEINYNYSKAKWTSEEDDSLRLQSFIVKEMKDLSLPNRTHASCVARLSFLRAEGKLVRDIARRWTPELDVQLIELINSGKRYKEIAEITGRSEATLRHRKMFLVRKFQQTESRK